MRLVTPTNTNKHNSLHPTTTTHFPGAITFVTATAFCWKLRTLVIGGYCILCMWGLYKALLAASPWQRRLCFLFPFVMRLHLVVLRCLKMAGGNTESMVHVYLQVRAYDDQPNC